MQPGRPYVTTAFARLRAVHLESDLVFCNRFAPLARFSNTMPSSALVGYARVSSVDQNLDRQLERLRSENVEKLFMDKASGKDTERPEFQAMMNYLRDGDVLLVCSMDRLARNLLDLLDVTKQLQNKGVTIRFLKENIELSPTGETSAISKLLLAMMGAVAEFERSLIRERQREGIALAKARGAYLGRKPLDPNTVAEAKRQVALGISKSKVARDLKISRTSLYRYLGNNEECQTP